MIRRLLRRLRLRLARALHRLAYALHELAAHPDDRAPLNRRTALYVPDTWLVTR